MTTFYGKAYEVSTSGTSANQNLSVNCRQVRIHAVSKPVHMAIGNVAQTAEGAPAEAVAVVTAAASGVKEKRKVTLSGFYEADDKLTVTVAGTAVTYTVTGANQHDTSSTTLNNVATSLKAALEANATINAAFTITVSSAVVNIEHKTVNTAFTLTAEVTAGDDDTHYLAVDRPYDIHVAPNTSLAFTTTNGSGTVYITELD